MSNIPYGMSRNDPNAPSRSLLRRFMPLLLALVVVGFTLIQGCEEGPFGRNRIVGMGLDQESALGAQAFREVLSKENIDRDPAINDAVGRVVTNLVRAATDAVFLNEVSLQRHEFDWQCSVVRSKQVNAFCLPGGKMVVYTGILPVARTEAGLAVVMGHEISHALARHGSERMAQQRAVEILRMGTMASFADMSPQTQRAVMQAFNMGSQFGVLLPYSRDHESEADHMGLLLMAKAGYDPSNAPRFWERMTEVSQGQAPPEFASTHPGHERRVAQLTDWQAEAEVLFRTSRPARDADRPLPIQ